MIWPSCGWGRPLQVTAPAGQRSGGEIRHRGRERLGEILPVRGGAAKGRRESHGALALPGAEKLLQLGGLPVGEDRPLGSGSTAMRNL